MIGEVADFSAAVRGVGAAPRAGLAGVCIEADR
jgi:hypothetical protein